MSGKRAPAPTRAEDLEAVRGSPYPASVAGTTVNRIRRRLGDAFGLEQFGANLLELPPGCDSSLRHWHSHEDELIWILEGEVFLVDDEGERRMRPGDCVGFRAGVPNAHCFRNRGTEPAKLLEIGSRRPDADTVSYPDVGMRVDQSDDVFRREDGEPFGN